MNIIRHMQLLKKLRNNAWLSTEELAKIQERKFKDILNYSYQNVLFYKRLYDSAGVNPENIKNIGDISKIPITSKSLFKNAGQEVIARNINSSDIVKEVTSGSTGNPFTLFFTKEERSIASLTYDRVRVENGFRLFRDVLLSTMGNEIRKNKEWYQQLGIARREKFNVFDPIDMQINIIKKMKPDVLWGYPSAIKCVTKEVKEKGIKDISPRLIFTASEVLDLETRNYINSVFNVELFDVYGSHESGCMAWECSRHSGYHMNMDTVLIEIVDENGDHVSPGERGKVVVTNLCSHAMPIIRYEIGDFAIPTDEECSCGRGGFLMKAIDGRSKDILITKEGKIIVSSFIPYLFYPNCTYSDSSFNPYKKIKQFQVIQKTKEDLLIKIVKESNSDERIFEYILTNFKNIFGDIDINLSFVDHIPPLPSGKSNYVVSYLKN